MGILASEYPKCNNEINFHFNLIKYTIFIKKRCFYFIFTNIIFNIRFIRKHLNFVNIDKLIKY